MAGATKNAVLLRDVQTLFGFGVVPGLLGCSASRAVLDCRSREAEAAFTLLVERHGPMVLHVCRQVLGDSHDTQDALPGHVPGVPASGRFDPQSRLAGQLALWSRLASGPTGAICGDRAAVS